MWSFVHDADENLTHFNSSASVWPVGTSSTFQVVQSLPASARPYAANRALSDGANPTRATVPSLLNVFGSSSSRGSPSSVSDTYRTFWFCSPSFFVKKYLPPSLNGAVYRSKFHNSVSRARIAGRSGISSRKWSVTLFWAATQSATSFDV